MARIVRDGADVGTLDAEQVDEGVSDVPLAPVTRIIYLPFFSSVFSDIVSLLPHASCEREAHGR